MNLSSVADNYTDTPASASSMAGSYTDTPAGEEPKEQCNCTCGGARCLQVMRRLHLRRGRCVACSYGDPMICTCQCSSCAKMNVSSMAVSQADTLAGGAAGIAAARPRPGTRGSPSGVVVRVVGACLAAGAAVALRAGAAWPSTYGLSGAPAEHSRHRVPLAFPVVECEVDCAALNSVGMPPGGWSPASEVPGSPGGPRRDMDGSHGAFEGTEAPGLSAADPRNDEADEVCTLMQSSAGAAASHLSSRDVYNMLLDREIARSLYRFAEADRIRDYLSFFGISIDDDGRRWRSRDGRRGRRPNVDDLRWDAGAAQEPVPRADRIAAALAADAEAGVWTTDRYVWNLLRDRELARRAYDYREADRIRSCLQDLGFQVDDNLYVEVGRRAHRSAP